MALKINPFTGKFDMIGGVDADSMAAFLEQSSQTKTIAAADTTVFLGADFPTPLTRKPKFISLCDADGIDLGLSAFPELNADATHWDLVVVNGGAEITNAVLTVI